MKRRTFIKISAVSAIFPSFILRAQEENDLIIKQAYIYSYPIVKNYLTLYQYAIKKDGSQYKGPINTLNSIARVYTPKDTGIITPNSDTPYSFIVMDLRSEPLILTMPAIETERYYSMQVIDLYTQNIDYIGTRKDGNSGGDFMIVGPSWKGITPKNISRVIRLTTEIGFGIIRTQLFSESDLANVTKIQEGYKIKTLSVYLGEEPKVFNKQDKWPEISDELIEKNFWGIASYLLQFAPPLPWESKIRSTFKEIGVIPGKAWPANGMINAEIVNVSSLKTLRELEKKSLTLTTSEGLFGSPDEMKGKYTERALGAMAGIYGNSVEEALYPSYLTDAQGERLDTSKFRYVFRLNEKSLPPVDAFWSITMYDGNSRLLVDNSLNRYLINSAMLSGLKADENGDIVIYMQHESPGEKLNSNWLPAPDGVMAVVMRLYLPKKEALDGRWKAPNIEKL